MISVSIFRICKKPEHIENYEVAFNDPVQVWECHHRKESVFSRRELILRGEYYDVEPTELIFLTRAEHNKLHKTGNKNTLGKHWTETTKKKLSCSKKGKKRKPFSEDCLRNMSISHVGERNGMYGKKHSQETREKISLSKKGKKWKKIDGKRVYFILGDK